MAIILRVRMSWGLSMEAIAKFPPNRQSASGEDEELKLSVLTMLSLSDEAIVQRREGGWDERFAITSISRSLWDCIIPWEWSAPCFPGEQFSPNECGCSLKIGGEMVSTVKADRKSRAEDDRWPL